jgi:RNA polymerase sigma-70 factor (ECF subfamily)
VSYSEPLHWRPRPRGSERRPKRRGTTPEADPRSDAALLAAARDGDDRAFGVLIARHARSALAVARGVVGDADLAEDVCQDALFRVWRRLGECREPERFGAWLARAVHRHALNSLRGRRETGPLTGIEPAAGAAPDAQAEQTDQRERLAGALEALSAEQRQAVLLFDLEGWSHAEIAALLGTSEAMSRQHLMLGRRRLRALLANEERPL